MDQLKLKIRQLDWEDRYADEVVHIYINDQNLLDLIREYELPFAEKEGHPDIAGGYGGLPVEDIFFPSRLLLGELPRVSIEILAERFNLSPEALMEQFDLSSERLNELNGSPEKVSILDCDSCGPSGCWPLKVKITVEEDRVIWSDFEQPFRSEDSHTHWNYDKFGPFVFDRQQYEQQLRQESST